MTISSTQVAVNYAGDGASTSFAVPFPFFGADEIGVYQRDSAGVITTLTRGVNYEVTGGGSAAATGTILATTAPASGITWTIRRKTGLTQSTVYAESDPFPASAHQNTADRFVTLAQELSEASNRAVRAPIGDDAMDPLPTKTNRASKSATFDANGNLTASAPAPGAVSISAAMTPVVGGATLATARGLMGFPAAIDSVLTAASIDAMRQAQGVHRAATVFMMDTSPATASPVWVVYKPDGTLLSTAGTTTNGFQEALNHALNNGYVLEVIGQGLTSGGSGLSVIDATTTITVPSCQIAAVYLRNVTLNLAPGGSNDGIIFNSAMMLHWEHHGQVVYTGNGAAVRVKPTTQVPGDPVTAFTDSVLHINSIAVIGGTNPNGVIFDMTSGGILNNLISFVEVNGAGVGAAGITVTNPGAALSFEQNAVWANHVHQWKNNGVRDGISQVWQSNIRHNEWHIGSVKSMGATARGIAIYGSYSHGIVGGDTNEEGSFQTGVQTRAGAVSNAIACGQVTGQSGSALVDGGTNTIVTGGIRVPNFGANKGKSYTPDGLLIQYINNAASSTGGVTTNWDAAFGTLLSCVASAANGVVAFQATATTTGVTITSASGTPNFNVVAVGRP